VWLKRTKDSNSDGSMSYNRAPKESIYLSTLSKSPQILKNLILEAMENGLQDEVGTVSIFVPDNYQKLSWVKALNKPKRSLQSVVLEGNLLKNTVEDVKTFLSSSLWYRDRGLPHRRGYLFYGAPGCGKRLIFFRVAFCLQ